MKEESNSVASGGNNRAVDEPRGAQTWTLMGIWERTSRKVLAPIGSLGATAGRLSLFRRLCVRRWDGVWKARNRPFQGL